MRGGPTHRSDILGPYQGAQASLGRLIGRVGFESEQSEYQDFPMHFIKVLVVSVR